MISYQQLKTKPALFKSFTGLTLGAFAELLPAFRQAYRDDLDRRDQHRSVPRQRQRGGGSKGDLPTREDKLVFILCCFRLYPIQVLQGFLFGMGQPQANEWIHRLTPVLNQALGYEKQLPARQSRDIEQVLAAAPAWSSSSTGPNALFVGPKTPTGSVSITAARRNAIPSRTTSSRTNAPGKSKAFLAPVKA